MYKLFFWILFFTLTVSNIVSATTSDEFVMEAYALWMTQYNSLADFWRDQWITRQEFAKFLHSTVKKSWVVQYMQQWSCVFEDVEKDLSLVAAVQEVCEQGLMKGWDTYFGYTVSLKRSELVSITMRMNTSPEERTSLLSQESEENRYNAYRTKAWEQQPYLIHKDPSATVSRGQALQYLLLNRSKKILSTDNNDSNTTSKVSSLPVTYDWLLDL